MIDADMLTIHLNFPQEMIQPEGNENAFGILEVIKNLSESFPIIVKECGSGITREVALLLKSAGIKGIEVSGVSGTSWVAVEYYRAKSIGDKAKENAGKIFWNWGVPSPVSVIECKKIDLPIVGSGGIRHGLDIAKSIAVGGDASSMARVLLSSALEGSDALMDKFKEIIEELKTAMFLTGSKNIEELKKAKYVLTGKIKDWVEQRSL
jgi:isopentenyl-diphosphate delta-isomerase